MPVSSRTYGDWLRLALCLSPLAVAPAVPNLGPIAALAIATASLAFIPAARVPSLALINETWGKSILLGLGTGLAIGLAAHFYEPWLTRLFDEPVELGSYSKVKGNFEAYVALLAIGIGIGGMLEEFVFRGFVIGWGSALLGEKAALWLALASAVSFGIGHSYQGPTGMIATGIDGAVFGAVYILAGRKLLPAMLCHASSNVIAITSLYLG